MTYCIYGYTYIYIYMYTHLFDRAEHRIGKNHRKKLKSFSFAVGFFFLENQNPNSSSSLGSDVRPYTDITEAAENPNLKNSTYTLHLT